jgi:hypothetical protein
MKYWGKVMEESMCNKMICSHCGASLLPHLRCPSCGGETPVESLFCCWCGSPTDVEDEKFDDAQRILCSDESCIGLINEQGFCKVCGKPYTGELKPIVNKESAMEDELSIDSFGTWAGKGFYLEMIQNKYGEAIEAYTKAIASEPNSLLEAYRNRARCYERLEIYSLALQDRQKVHEIEPSYDSLCARGNIYCKMKEFQKAIDDYTEAIELDSKNADAFNGRGEVYFNWEKYQLAINEYSIAIHCEHSDKEYGVALCVNISETLSTQ